MLGMKYLRYYPETVFQLLSKLTIYKSWFKNADSTGDVIGGLIRLLQKLNQNTTSTQHLSYQINNSDASLLHCKVEKDRFNDFMSNTDEILEPSNEQMKVQLLHSSLLVRNLKIFEEVENAGSEISYRCKICKQHEIIKTQIMSIKK